MLNAYKNVPPSQIELSHTTHKNKLKNKICCFKIQLVKFTHQSKFEVVYREL